MATLVDDDGWNAELIPGARSKGYKYIDDLLVKYNLVVQTKGTTYIYLTASNQWASLATTEAQKQICDIVGYENVSVNYLPAALPYFSYITKVSTRIASIPVSVCIGTRRLCVYMNENNMRLKVCDDVISIPDNISDRIGGFCMMPCNYRAYPTEWDPAIETSLHIYLSALFTDPVELDTVKWIIGLAVVDPGTHSKFLLLYGPGGTGKSELVNVIGDVLSGCSSIIKTSQLTDTKGEMTMDTAKALASNRVVTTGELNLDEKPLNLHIIKEITGHDSINIPPIKVSTRCSVVSSSNYLPNPRVQSEWLSSAIARRVVVVPMQIQASLLPAVQRPDTEKDYLDFLMSCIYTYLNNQSMPMSVRSALFSVLGDAYRHTAEMIVIGPSTDTEIIEANTYIEVNNQMDSGDLGEYVYVKSPSLVVVLGGKKFLRDIKLIDR